MRGLETIRRLVRDGLYYLTEHADCEAGDEGLDVWDVRFIREIPMKVYSM